MNLKKVPYLLVALLLVTILAIPASPTLASPPPDMEDVLVTFYQPPGPDEIELIESLGGIVTKVYHIVPTIAAAMPSENLDELEADPRVKLIEPDITISMAFAGEVLPWGVDRVDAELVHPSNKGTGVKVAILDSGIDLAHPDLAVAGDVTFVEGTTSGDDDNGHGTLVAGIVAALDNDIGVIGVAPEASLYAVKVLRQDGGGSMSVILSGIEWTVDNNMQVINMSFGGIMNWPVAVKDALDNAYSAGMVIVAGAGNGGDASGEGENMWAPARFEPVIAVGATDELDARYTASSTGDTLELMAPGVNIYSTAMGGGYGYQTGTSASSPHAAGVAALLIASGMTSNIDIRHRLRHSAEDLGAPGPDTRYGNGMVNADLAINFTEPPDQSAPITTVSFSGTPGNNGWYISDGEIILSATDTGGSGVAETQYSLDDGQTWYTYISPLPITGEGYTPIWARSWDNAGNTEWPRLSKEIKVDQTPPPATTISLSGAIGNYGWYISDVQVTLTATDTVSGVAKIEYSLDSGETWNTYTPPLTITTDGNNTVLARAWDNAGNVEETPTSRTFKIDQTPPVLTETAIPAVMDRIRKGVMVDIDYSGTATDPLSGLNTNTINIMLIDEYGVLDQYLGSSLSSIASVEAWCNGNDRDGRTYIIRLTAQDLAGNEGYVDAIVTVIK